MQEARSPTFATTRRTGTPSAAGGRPAATTHDEIRRVARRLFTQRGYGNVTLAMIAAEAGIGRTTLFAYFPAKQDLLWEEYEAGIVRLNAAVTAAQPDAPVMDVLLTAIVDEYRFDLADHDDLAARWAVVEAEPELVAGMLSRQLEATEVLTRFAAGRLPEVDAGIVACAVAALTAAAVQLARLWAQDPRPRLSLDEFVKDRLVALARPLGEFLRMQ